MKNYVLNNVLPAYFYRLDMGEIPGGGAVYYFSRSNRNFLEIFSLKMPLNASKVPKELFNSYQNSR